MTSSPSCTERGDSSDAPNVFSAMTAKPSTFDRSNEGTSTGETTSAASTRPSAASSGTVSTPRGARSIAARKRRSASSRSSTWRNCSCSGIEPDLHFGAGRESFAVGWDDDEAVAARGRRKHGRSADGDGLDASVDELHAGVIQPPDGRADLARQLRTHRTVRPRLWTSAQGTNRAAGEKIIGTETGHGIAWERKHEPMLDSPKASRTAGPHGDPVDGQLAALCEKRRREVLDSDARTTGHDDHI